MNNLSLAFGHTLEMTWILCKRTRKEIYRWRRATWNGTLEVNRTWSHLTKRGFPFEYILKYGSLETKIHLCVIIIPWKWIFWSMRKHRTEEKLFWIYFSGMAASIIAKPRRWNFYMRVVLLRTPCVLWHLLYFQGVKTSQTLLDVKYMTHKHCPSKILWWKYWLNIVKEARSSFMRRGVTMYFYWKLQWYWETITDYNRSAPRALLPMLTWTSPRCNVVLKPEPEAEFLHHQPDHPVVRDHCDDTVGLPAAHGVGWDGIPGDHCHVVARSVPTPGGRRSTAVTEVTPHIGNAVFEINENCYFNGFTISVGFNLFWCY